MQGKTVKPTLLNEDGKKRSRSRGVESLVPRFSTCRTNRVTSNAAKNTTWPLSGMVCIFPAFYLRMSMARDQTGGRRRGLQWSRMKVKKQIAGKNSLGGEKVGRAPPAGMWPLYAWSRAFSSADPSSSALSLSLSLSLVWIIICRAASDENDFIYQRFDLRFAGVRESIAVAN